MGGILGESIEIFAQGGGLLEGRVEEDVLWMLDTMSADPRFSRHSPSCIRLLRFV